MDCIVHGVAKSRARLSSFHLDLVCLSRSAYLEFVHFVRNYQNYVSHFVTLSYVNHLDFLNTICSAVNTV